jgi:phage baseplate assembly protein W
MSSQPDPTTSFLGRGWSFPPQFLREAGEVSMTAGEADIAASLEILFRTAPGERFLVPKYGLDMHELLFEPMSTTMLTLLKDRIKVAILVYEPRITLLSLDVRSPDVPDGALRVSIEYEVRATNSRYNLVFPFYRHDSNEVRPSVDIVAAARA